MSTGRLEAFSDGVLAIIITIMVLQLEVPKGASFHALTSTIGLSLLSYVLSFVYVGIYWNNHHHMFQATNRVTGGMLWANLHLLFWLSLLPFSTTWMNQTDLSSTPVLIYGVNLLAAAIAYLILQIVIVRGEGPGSLIEQAIGRNLKGKASAVLYLLGIGLAALGGHEADAWVYSAIVCFVVVAVIWLVPDRQIEQLTAG